MVGYRSRLALGGMLIQSALATAMAATFTTTKISPNEETEANEPYFAIYNNNFSEILGATPCLTVEVEKDFQFAHEAGIYVPSEDTIYITSNKLVSEDSQAIIVGAVRREYGKFRYEEIHPNVTMGNGGTNYHDDGLLFCDQGNRTRPSGIKLVRPVPPYDTQTLISSYRGVPFNSPNDVVVRSDGSIWFTDPIYGSEQGFRGAPQLPNQVYRFDPATGDVRVVADGFGRPNGLAFSPDEQTLYITDTNAIHGNNTMDPTRASTIYAFDVKTISGSSFLVNRRLFAFPDTGHPDGIKCDLAGNVYSGCGDGINVWSPGGILIGKLIIPGGIANFCFGRPGEIFILGETKFWLAKISDKVQGALLAGMGIAV